MRFICRNSPDCGQAGLPAEGSLMRRPLFMACLCLVIVLAIGRILTGADTGDAGVLPPDGSPVRITGRIDTRTSETIILKSISIIQNDLKYSYSGKLQCELERKSLQVLYRALTGPSILFWKAFFRTSMLRPITGNLTCGPILRERASVAECGKHRFWQRRRTIAF